MSSLLRGLAVRLRRVSGGDATPKSPIRALLDAVANEIERLADALGKLTDDSFIKTADGEKQRPNVSDRPRWKDDP